MASMTSLWMYSTVKVESSFGSLKSTARLPRKLVGNFKPGWMKLTEGVPAVVGSSLVVPSGAAGSNLKARSDSEKPPPKYCPRVGGVGEEGVGRLMLKRPNPAL